VHGKGQKRATKWGQAPNIPATTPIPVAPRCSLRVPVVVFVVITVIFFTVAYIFIFIFLFLFLFFIFIVWLLSKEDIGS